VYVEKSEYSALIRSDRSFEWEALRRHILTFRKRYIASLTAIVFLGFYFMYLAYRWWMRDTTSGIVYTALGIYWLILHPVIMLKIKLKPKEYRISARGVWLDGNLVTWKNYRCYEKRGRFLYLVSSHANYSFALPSEVEDVVSKYLLECSQKGVEVNQ